MLGSFTPPPVEDWIFLTTEKWFITFPRKPILSDDAIVSRYLPFYRNLIGMH
jgi:hypothetical protein